jgi:hypothetical protein
VDAFAEKAGNLAILRMWVAIILHNGSYSDILSRPADSSIFIRKISTSVHPVITLRSYRSLAFGEDGSLPCHVCQSSNNLFVSIHKPI